MFVELFKSIKEVVSREVGRFDIVNLGERRFVIEDGTITCPSTPLDGEYMLSGVTITEGGTRFDAEVFSTLYNFKGGVSPTDDYLLDETIEIKATPQLLNVVFLPNAAVASQSIKTEYHGKEFKKDKNDKIVGVLPSKVIVYPVEMKNGSADGEPTEENQAKDLIFNYGVDVVFIFTDNLPIPHYLDLVTYFVSMLSTIRIGPKGMFVFKETDGMAIENNVAVAVCSFNFSQDISIEEKYLDKSFHWEGGNPEVTPQA